MFGKGSKSSKNKNETRSAMLNVDTDMDVKFESNPVTNAASAEEKRTEAPEFDSIAEAIETVSSVSEVVTSDIEAPVAEEIKPEEIKSEESEAQRPETAVIVSAANIEEKFSDSDIASHETINPVAENMVSKEEVQIIKPTSEAALKLEELGKVNQEDNRENTKEKGRKKTDNPGVKDKSSKKSKNKKDNKNKELYSMVSNYDDSDPDLFDGNVSLTSRNRKKVVAAPSFRKNNVIPVEVDIKGNPEDAYKPSAKSRHKAAFYVITSIVIVILVVCGTVFYEAGIKDKLNSPLTINGVSIDSSEFSFMYHYILIENGVDIFATDTPDMLAEASDDPNFSTNREYFLDLTAKELQTMQVLYDDATSHGGYIKEEHYALARAYVDWLKGKASDINVSLDTYIKGVFGSQVDEQCVLNTLAKKYFTEDYSSGDKLVELSASNEQANAAYEANMNAYDLVDYKLLRIVYEQREDSFITTANIHANEIIEAMGHDSDMFELAASEYFTGDDQERLLIPDYTLVSNVRYTDFTHNEFRDWLFNPTRTSGDTTIFEDSDGFPILLCFVDRYKQSVPLRNVRIVTISYDSSDEISGELGSEATDFYSIAQAQETAQSIYEYISSANGVAEIENIYTDEVLRGIVTVTSDAEAYVNKYEDVLNNWIFDSSRKANDKKILEGDGCFYVVFFVSESENPEWYDRVNSFIRMNNYQAFINEMVTEYDYSFNRSALDEIQDVP